MENKKMTKVQTINLLIDVLNGVQEVEDMQIFVDFLVHERELLEKKSSNSGQTKTQKENEVIKDKIVNALRVLDKFVTITELQESNEEIANYSNQKVSALLKQLVDSNIVSRQVDKKKAYFKLVD
jgi:DNA-binding transcriptional regulator GbsR (MarR family)